LWSKQYYHFVVADWLKGDPSQPPAARLAPARTRFLLRHIYNEDVIAMPDTWNTRGAA
jgi:hypothetical protein